MIKRIWFLLPVIFLFLLPACISAGVTEPTATPVDFDLEEELAEQAIATAYAKKTQIASRVLPYVKLSNGEQRYLAFWFTWNDETVLLSLNEFVVPDSSLVTCRLASGTEIVSGALYTGFALENDECVTDETAAENAPPVIKVPRYFEDGIDPQNLNIIDLNGEHAENLAEILTVIVKNDLFGSGDINLSIHRTDSYGGDLFGDEDIAPTFVLPEKMLQVSFSTDQIGEFEGADDVTYALEREFTWKIPDGFSDLDLSPGDENWFVLRVRETKNDNNQGDEHLLEAYIQVKGVDISSTP